MSEPTIPRNGDQIGVADRFNHSLCDLVRNMQEHHSLPEMLKTDTFSVAAPVRSRATCRRAPATTTPRQMIFAQRCNLSHVRVLMCR